MIYFRLILFLVVSGIYIFKLFEEYSDHQISNYAAAIMSWGFAIALYAIGKMYCFAHEKTIYSTKAFFFIENIYVPIMPFVFFIPIAISGSELKANVLVWLPIIWILSIDYDEGFRKFFWDNRIYEFKKASEDGVIDRKKMSEMGLLYFGTTLGAPIVLPLFFKFLQ